MTDDKGVKKYARFVLQIESALKQKTDAKIEDEKKKAVKEALDKVRAEESAKAQTGRMSRFFG